jgi:hypothetical protein
MSCYALLCLAIFASSSIECASLINDSSDKLDHAKNFFTHYSKPFGGLSGNYFGGFVPSDEKTRVSKVITQTSIYIINIQLVLTDSNGIESYSPVFGAPSREFSQEWIVPAGEYITKIEIRHAALIDAITFITDKGYFYFLNI